MSDIIGLLGAAGGGGLTGILGTVFGRAFGFFEKKQQNEHDLKLMEFKVRQNDHELTVLDREFQHEKELQSINMKAQAMETEREISLVNVSGSWAGMDSSLKHDSAIGQASLWVINTIRLVRPCLTVMLWLIVVVLVKMGAAQSYIEAAIYAASAATLWWFGDRAPKPKGCGAQGAEYG